MLFRCDICKINLKSVIILRIDYLIGYQRTTNCISLHIENRYVFIMLLDYCFDYNCFVGDLFRIYFEKEEILTSETLVDAVMETFGLYFILNLEYPKEISTFLEMFQRYHLKIHPDIRTKSKKKSSSKKKIIFLIKQLS